MKKGTNKPSHKHKKRKKLGGTYLICWLIIPISTIGLLVLDAIGLYSFNTERIIVIGACVIIVLIPFFNEITIKNLSLKKDNNG